MSMNEYQRVVCFALSLTLASLRSTVCKLQSRFTNMPRVRIRSTVLNAFNMRYQHNTWVKLHAFHYIVNLIVFATRNQHAKFLTQGSTGGENTNSSSAYEMMNRC